ncbi:MAG: lipocalin family protein [Candidatus Thermoplasmatota archaeon]|nr:lipocalin family protein [Candidatus Thermoplasmatota archaeon]
MVFGSLAGCLGSEDDDSVVGDWFVVSQLMVDMKADGTWTSGQDENGTWSVDGDMLYITSDEREEEIPPVQFTINDGWLWMKISTEDGYMCVVYSPDSMTQEVWDARMESITPPSLCDGLAMAN